MTRDAAAASSVLSTRDAASYNAYAPVTTVRFDYDSSTAIRLQFYRATPIRWPIRSFHSIHNVVDRGVDTDDVGGTCGPSCTPRSTHYLLTTPI